jgi:putative lipoic acid-binding regulatory protein
MGKNSESLKANVLALAHSEFPQLTLDDLTERPSKGNKYLALSFTVPAENKEQLDRLYQKLTQAPEVIMAF